LRELRVDVDCDPGASILAEFDAVDGELVFDAEGTRRAENGGCVVKVEESG